MKVDLSDENIRREMNLFVDFEMTGLSMKDKPISIGIVTDTTDVFYAEFNDYRFGTYCSEWVEENVVKNLLYNDIKQDFITVFDRGIMVKGDTDRIREELVTWLNNLKSDHRVDEFQFVGDVCHYDFCLFLELFGGAFGVEGLILPASYDINYDIAKYIGGDVNDAFDVNREELCNKLTGEEIDTTSKHNAVFDAGVIKKIYDKLVRENGGVIDNG